MCQFPTSILIPKNLPRWHTESLEHPPQHLSFCYLVPQVGETLKATLDGDTQGWEAQWKRDLSSSALGIRAGGNRGLRVVAVPSGCPQGTGPSCVWPFFLRSPR